MTPQEALEELEGMLDAAFEPGFIETDDLRALLVQVDAGSSVTLTVEEASIAAFGLSAVLDIENRYIFEPDRERAYRALRAKLSGGA